MKTKRIILHLTIGILIATISNTISAQSLYSQINKFGKVIGSIDMFYVDSIDREKLIELAIERIVEELDPHSAYLTRKEVKEMNEPLQGGFEGIGIQFNVLYDTIFVINPISGGPSEKLGIRAGDRIVKINNENVAGIGISSSEVRDKLMGKKGTEVDVSIKRKGLVELLDFTITRDKIPIFSLDASYMVNDSIGYLKLNQFSLTSLDEIYDALNKFKKTDFQHLVLDLRNNGGGYLQVAIELADEFLEDQKLIVYTQGLNIPKREYHASRKGNFEIGKLVILIDEGSASASEIVSGAVQDWDRGVIIGRRSFGKGLVQRPINLPDTSMLKLTVAKYYTPTGRSIQKPYEIDNKEYAKDLINRYNHGELVNEDSIIFPDSLKFNTLVNNRIVYGGGGIMPDYFIPLDTTSTSDYYRKLVRQGTLNRFILSYVDDNRDALKQKYRSFKKYNKEFIVADDIMKQLTDNAYEKDSLEFNEEEYLNDVDDIKLLVKAYIARDLWNTSEFYQIINETDDGFNKAIEILQSPTKYNQLLTRSGRLETYLNKK